MRLSKLIVLATVLLLACNIFAQAQQLTPVQKLAAQAQLLNRALPLMPTAPPGFFRSHLWVGQALPGTAQLYTPPSSCNKITNGHYLFCPPSLEIAYGTPSILGANGGAGMTIAIVDAFHYAHVEADLNFFSTDMNLPACTTGNGCFKDVDENGGTNYCGPNSNWELETMLDVEWAHAMAPNAKIVLVEGCDNSFDSLNTAITTAITKEGADIVSNSYGAAEFNGENAFDPVYNVNKPILFSSGDVGAEVQYPCASPYTTCVGGTNLQVDANFHRVNETAWSGGGGGCSAFEAIPGYQSSNGVTICSPNRAVPDVSAVADPNTGVAVYDSGNGGYFRVGGTSVACPVTAAIYADVMAARVGFGKAKFGQMDATLYLPYKLYGKPGSNYLYFYYDVTQGSNGHQAGPGYDLATGLGVSYGVNMANRFFGLP